MKKAVIYGAGNIGRGFIGQLFSQSGYDVCFIEVNETIVNELNRRGEYPVVVLLKKGSKEELIQNVRAVNGKNLEAVVEEIAKADIIATAVGVNVLPLIAMPFAAGLTHRFKTNPRPLDIIICENMINADKYFRKLINEKISPAANTWANENVGYVEASIGRMVPIQTDEMRSGDPLRVCVEEYAELPVDKDAFKAEIPAIKNLVPVSHFSFYIERKLFIHNLGHAMTAYLGFQRGYTYIWEAIADPGIRELVFKAMLESGIALSKKHNADFFQLYQYINDLIERFGNRQLGDTVARVGNDLKRKLSEGDRMFGAARLCEEQKTENTHILKGIAAALLFEESGKALTIEKLRQIADIIIK